MYIKVFIIQQTRLSINWFIVWMLCMSREVRKVDAACQVHVWHVSKGYTIISSSSLSEFIVLNFCPSLNIWRKHGIQLRLVNGNLSEGICGCLCVQPADHLHAQSNHIFFFKSDKDNVVFINGRFRLTCSAFSRDQSEPGSCLFYYSSETLC